MMSCPTFALADVRAARLGKGSDLDRPNGGDTDPTTVAHVPPPQSGFLITAPPTAASGTPFYNDHGAGPSGNIDSNYQGTVTFSTTDPDVSAVLPADYTFAIGEGGDNGMHISRVGHPRHARRQTLTLNDTASGITGGVTVAVGPGP